MRSPGGSPNMVVFPRYCYALPRISIISRIMPIVLNILKHPGSIPDLHGSPRSCQGFVTVWLQFFTDVHVLTIRDDPASEPGQWDFTGVLAQICGIYLYLYLYFHEDNDLHSRFTGNKKSSSRGKMNCLITFHDKKLYFDHSSRKI